ncbi:MAG: hypothetical protein ACFB0B_03230 [Thermonemataceae bacterium]
MFVYLKRISWILLLALLACKELPDLKDFDEESWQADKMGCNAQRLAAIESFRMNKEAMMGLSQKQIMQLLGKPDEQNLYRRNQKFYVYYLRSSTCEGVSKTAERAVSIRFSAIDNVTEINID